MTTDHPPTLDALIDLIGEFGREVYYLLDDCETSGPVGEETHTITPDGLQKVSDLLDRIDALPFEEPGCILGTGAMLQAALKQTVGALIAGAYLDAGDFAADWVGDARHGAGLIPDAANANLLGSDIAARAPADATAALAEIRKAEREAGRQEARALISFALARIEEWAADGIDDGNCRDWLGHVAPALDRLKAFADDAPAPAVTLADGVAAIAAERQRQIEAEGWTPEHDDQHAARQMALAAGCYAMYASAPEAHRAATDMPGSLNVLGRPLKGWAAWLQLWPWDRKWWKPTTPRRDLVKAGALIVAEIERLDRAALRAAQEGGDA